MRRRCLQKKANIRTATKRAWDVSMLDSESWSLPGEFQQDREDGSLRYCLVLGIPIGIHNARLETPLATADSSGLEQPTPREAQGREQEGRRFLYLILQIGAQPWPLNSIEKGPRMLD